MSQGLLLSNVMFAYLLYGLKLREKGPRNCTVRKRKTKTLKKGFLLNLRFTHSDQLCSLLFFTLSLTPSDHVQVNNAASQKVEGSQDIPFQQPEAGTAGPFCMCMKTAAL